MDLEGTLEVLFWHGSLKFSLAGPISRKKGCGTVAMLPQGNRQKHPCQKDFGQDYRTFCIFEKQSYIYSKLFPICVLFAEIYILSYL